MLAITISGCGPTIEYTPSDEFSIQALEKGAEAPFSGVLIGDGLFLDMVLKLEACEEYYHDDYGLHTNHVGYDVAEQ
jgi:hypothetical protein